MSIIAMAVNTGSRFRVSRSFSLFLLLLPFFFLSFLLLSSLLSSLPSFFSFSHSLIYFFFCFEPLFFTHLLTHSLSLPFICPPPPLSLSVSHILIYSLTRSLTRSFARLFTHSLTRSLAYSLTYSPIRSFTHLLTLLIFSLSFLYSYSYAFLLIFLKIFALFLVLNPAYNKGIILNIRY